jgi:hypothetical protein
MAKTGYATFTAPINGIHGSVHIWVGGTMSDAAVSPADPVFWLHHANLDRLWWSGTTARRRSSEPAARRRRCRDGHTVHTGGPTSCPLKSTARRTTSSSHKRATSTLPRELVAMVGPDWAELFVYPGDAHLFVDSSLPTYDADAAALVTQRTLHFLSVL